jgi:hypothetical protein
LKDAKTLLDQLNRWRFGLPWSHSVALTTNLKAPTSGIYSGILFFQDRIVPTTAPGNILPGTGLEGALYFPTTKITYNEGSVASVAYTIIVAYALSNQINTLTINSNFSSLADGSSLKSICARGVILP